MMYRVKSLKLARGAPYSLRLEWDDGRKDLVDLSGVIFRYSIFTPLRNDPKLFRAAAIIDGGLAIGWTEEMDYSAQSLRRVADEQRPMSGDELLSFEAQNKLTAVDTATVLDIGVRTVKAYRRAKKLPTPVAIAIRAMRAEPALLAAHYKPKSKRNRAA
jgi:hypothetical protein